MLPATQFDLGAIILHEEDGKLKSIQHVQRMLLPVEMNYSQIEVRFSYHIYDQEIS